MPASPAHPPSSAPAAPPAMNSSTQAAMFPPIPDHARVLTNIDAFTLLLHLARGAVPAVSLLRGLWQSVRVHCVPALPKLSLLLSCIHVRAREAASHLEDLALWF